MTYAVATIIGLIVGVFMGRASVDVEKRAAPAPAPDRDKSPRCNECGAFHDVYSGGCPLVARGAKRWDWGDA